MLKFLSLDNYRSTQQILDISSRVIDNNETRIVKHISGISKTLLLGKIVNENKNFSHFRMTSPRRLSCSQKVKKHLKQNFHRANSPLSSRTNREVEAWTDFFQNNSILVESKLRADILSSRFVKLFLNLIKTIQDPHKNDAAIISLLRSSLFDTDKVDVLRLTRALYKKNYTTKWKLTIFDYLSEDAFSSPKTKEITESDQLSLLENPTKTDQGIHESRFISFRDLILDFQSKSGEMVVTDF